MIIGTAVVGAGPFVTNSSMWPLEVTVFSLSSSVYWLRLGVVVSTLSLAVNVSSLCPDNCWLRLAAVASLLCLVVSLFLLGPVVVGSVVSMLLLVMLSIISFFWGFVVDSILGGVLLLLFLVSMLFVGVEVVLGFKDELATLPDLDALFILTDVSWFVGHRWFPLMNLLNLLYFLPFVPWVSMCTWL